ncbi:hypothetical protein [Actinomadura sp. 9N407]|uniref:hypothetical protein n=1 Tax=Actinomadura sp. 9N407 TaxID=3375154 RepID=UPI00379CDB4A
MQAQFDYVIRQIEAANTIPSLMASALIGLDLIERATTLLAQIAPEESFPACQAAIAEASDARNALAEAPALAWRKGSEGSAPANVHEFTEAITTLILVAAENALNAASKTTEPADRVACLQAVQHLGRLYSALK